MGDTLHNLTRRLGVAYVLGVPRPKDLKVRFARGLVPIFAIALGFLIVSGCSRRTVPKKEETQVEKKGPPAEVEARPAAPEGAQQGLEAPPTDLPIQMVSGAELVKMTADSGKKGTVVNAWASWCGPCRREFPMLVSLRDNLRAQGMDVTFVSVDEPDSHGAAIEFATTNGLEPPILVAERPLGQFKREVNPKWPGMLPATFLFDDTGKLRYFWGGPVYEQELLPIVERFLAGEHIDGAANFGLTPGKDFRHQ